MPHHFASSFITLEDLLNFLDILITKLGEVNVYHCIAGRHATDFAKHTVNTCELLLNHTKTRKKEDAEEKERLEKEALLKREALEFIDSLPDGIDLELISEIAQICVDVSPAAKLRCEVDAIASISKSDFSFSDLNLLILEHGNAIHQMMNAPPIRLTSSVADILDVLAPLKH